MQLCQHEGTASVGLHPVARLHWDERGSDDHAVVAEIGELPVQAIAAWPGLIAELELTPIAPQLLGKLANMIGAVRNCAPVPHFAAPVALRKRHRNRRLMDIQPDKNGMLQLVCPPFLKLGASQSGATSKENAAGETTCPAKSNRDHGV